MEFSFDLCHGTFSEIEIENEPEKERSKKETKKDPIKKQPLSEPIYIPFTPPEINYLE